MAETLDQDIYALKEWFGGAWRQLADPLLTSYDRREIRNYMKDAEIALGAGLKRIAARERPARSGDGYHRWPSSRFSHHCPRRMNAWARRSCRSSPIIENVS